MSWTPARRRGVEILDDPATPVTVRHRAMADVARANALFGGRRSILRALRAVLPHLPADAILLDVGTGIADIPQHAQQSARRKGIALTPIGLDVSESIGRAARRRLAGVVVGDATRLPVKDAGADVVTCSQLLHHFEDREAGALIAELHRAARAWVVVSDLRRSWIAAAGFWVASTLLRFHPVTRRDGVTSVFRGFTAAELESLVLRVTGIKPRVRRGIFWRLSATWHKPPD